jgi:mRNA interferase MazF
MGREMKKTRPCLVISPDELNLYLSTIIIAPLTTQSRDYPTRVETKLDGKIGWIALDQLRTVDSARLYEEMGSIGLKTIFKVKQVLQEMLVD